MKRDELYKPLGKDPERAGRGRVRGLGILAVVGVLAGTAGMWLLHRPTEPLNEATVDIVVRKPEAQAPSAPRPSTPNIPGAGQATFDIENGVKVVRGGSLGPSSGTLIPVAGDAAGPSTGASAGLPPAPDPRLVENGRSGPLPKIGPDGDSPFDVYKKPLSDYADRPKLAVVVTGLGLAPDSVLTAAERLPEQTSFAFAPIGRDLWRESAEARRSGHEILLQEPMEPIAADGGSKWPHELTVAAAGARDAAELEWGMSRFPGYFGVMNFLGSRLTMDHAAITPLLQEIGGRGLGYLDDGSSPASQAAAVAAALGLHSARADLALDPNAPSPVIEDELSKLIEKARDAGSAILVAPALPQILDRVASFEAEASAAGLQLVPVSALMTQAPSQAASTK